MKLILKIHLLNQIIFKDQFRLNSSIKRIVNMNFNHALYVSCWERTLGTIFLIRILLFERITVFARGKIVTLAILPP